MKIVNLIKLVCKRCGWIWTPRGAEVRICPRCKSKLWEKERDAEKQAGEEPPIIWSRDSYGSFLESKEKA